MKNVEAKNGTWMEAMITNVNEFIWRWNRGRFLECRKEKVVGRKSTYQFIPLSFIKRISELQDIMAKHSAALFLMYSTLLGWRRECSIIPHTTDIDTGVLLEEYSPGLVDEIGRSWTFWKESFIQNLKEPEKPYMFAVNAYVDVYKKRKIDVFFVQSEKNISFAQSTGMGPNRLQKSVYPRIKEICSVDLLNHLMFVPCDVDAFIEVG